MNTRGFIHHPFVWMLIAFLVGVILTVLAARDIIPIGFSLCGCK
jgi:hypothetical protein